MPPAYQPDNKERIREAIDIVDLVGSYAELRRQGRMFVAHCPWHDDTRPSLQVNPDRQSWKCWVCDIGGDIFSFVMQREGIDFREALEMLADRAGISLEQHQQVSPGSAQDKKTLFAAMSWAAEQMHLCLCDDAGSAAARRYLDERGINATSRQRFQIGFSANNWQWLVDRARAKFSTEVLQAVGLVGTSAKSGQLYDRFKGRIIFPIHDTQGRTVALGGRILPDLADDRSAKYINSPETRLFSKSDQLYALDIVGDSIRKSRHAIVVEGYTDVVMLNQFGVPNVVAVLGTALGRRHIRLLRRYADRITLVLDGDEAGQRRTSEILQLFIAEQVDLRVLTLPDGKDPCDYVQAFGVDSFSQLADSAVDALEHKVRTATNGLNPSTDTHRASQAMEEILTSLAGAPRLRSDTTTDTRLREQQILTRLAREFRVPESEVRGRLTALRRTARRAPSGPPTAEHESKFGDSLTAWERELFEVLLLQPEAVPLAAKAIPVEHFQPGAAQVLYSTFCRMAAAGLQPDFQRVLAEMEEAKWKNLLVDLDEQAHAKVDSASEDLETRLKGLIEHYQQQKENQQQQNVVAALDQRQLDDQQELEMLEQLLQQKRNRLGTSAPTDG